MPLFDAHAKKLAVGDWSGSAVQGQTLANAGSARRGEEARQVRWLESLMPRTDRASRVIAAPPERVWAALVNPEALMAWLPPGGMTGRFERFDARPGGSYRMVLTYSDASGAPGKATAESDIVEARFVDIVPGERVVQAVDFVSDDPAYAGTMTMTWEVTVHGRAAPLRTPVTRSRAQAKASRGGYQPGGCARP